MQKVFTAIVTLLSTYNVYSQRMITQTPEVAALRTIKDSTELRAKLNELGNSGSEKDYATLYTYYQLVNARKADSVGKVIVNRFPKGAVALDIASVKMFGKDIVQQEKVLAELKEEFPGQDFNKYNTYLINSFLGEKNASGAFKYFDLLSEPERTRAFNSIAGSVINFDAAAAAAFLANELSRKDLKESDKMNLLQLQSSALFNTGDYQKAFQSISTVYENTARKSPQLQTEYYLLMSKTGRHAEALPHLEEAMLNRAGGDRLKQELIAAWQAVHPGKDVEAYMAGLKRKMNNNVLQEVEKTMVKEKAPSFTVLNEQGKEVSLSDFRGKTIVIDFWATWCGPCKRALPAMQATVNKYKDDPDVVFLFIHTWEGKGKDKDAKAAAKKYFMDNNYNNLPLYMDLQNASKVNPAVSAFKVTGIPAKFVIDRNGNIRFKKEGSGMDMDYNVAELSAMIDLSKK
ncbi:MAG: TlpA family protein disulfide reductase [Pseudobacter sp.]|uniref:TlpA family protein disulfide reductase n=1 Tax=Pseudobacter sp. TaxID=2045420 RepID=UPI003F8107DD